MAWFVFMHLIIVITINNNNIKVTITTTDKALLSCDHKSQIDPMLELQEYSKLVVKHIRIIIIN